MMFKPDLPYEALNGILVSVLLVNFLRSSRSSETRLARPE